MSTDRKLDELDYGSDIADADLIYSLQGDVSVKQAAVNLRDYVFSGGQGDVTLSDGFAYIGGFNSQTFPVTGIGAAFGWNFGGGSGEVDVWNVFPAASAANDTAAFTFKQLSGTGTGRTVATLYQGGRINGTMLTAGGTFTGQATQLELAETGLASSTGAGQVRIDRTEANTPSGGEEAQINIGLHRTGGTGSREAIQLQIDSTVGTGDFIIGLNALAYAKKDGAAHSLSAFGSISAVKVDAALPAVDAVAFEVDMDARGNVARKIALQVVDQATSVGAGTTYDAGIVVGTQAGGARGFNYALQFGFSLGNAAAEINNAFIYCPSGTIPYGIDFSGVTFSTAAWKGNFTATGTVKGLVTVVGSLPSAATAGVGARAFVTDANATTFASTVANGGSNKVPVYSDGTNWKIG